MKRTKLADDYLNLKAQQAQLADAELKIKNQLLAMKDTEFEGKTGRVTISETDGRTTYDAELLKRHVPAATLNLCKKTGARSVRFNVTARVAKSKVAA